MNNDISHNGNDFNVVPEKPRVFGISQELPFEGIEMVSETVQLYDSEVRILLVSKCDPKRLCSPVPEFDMIEKCNRCGKLI